MTKNAIIITGYLSNKVADMSNKLAKDSRRHLSTIVKDAKGSMSKFDVLNGKIFFELKDEKGLTELQEALKSLDDVVVEEVSPIMLVYMKSQAQASQKVA